MCIAINTYGSPQGSYGGTYGLTSESCSGFCTKGYRCNYASPSPTQFPCWDNSTMYCPEGSYQPILVPAGYYSVGDFETTKYTIVSCPPGMYCVDGLKNMCPAGRYSAMGSPTADCDGLCDAGYYCPTMSTSPTQFPCPAGRFGTRGMTDSACSGSCLRGYYCPLTSTRPFEYECGDEYHYCPHGSPAPIPVSLHHFSTGGNSTTRFAQSRCVFSETEGTPPAADRRINICPSTTVF
jgi:hypothetical protein